MPWSYFRELTRPVRDGLGVSPGNADHPIISLPQRPAALRPMPIESDAGPALPAPPEVEAYIVQARPRLRSPRVSDDFWLPDRIRMITEGRSRTEAVRLLLMELMRNPQGDALIEARAVLNELGRDPEGAAAVRDQITPEVLARVFDRNQREE